MSGREWAGYLLVIFAVLTVLTRPLASDEPVAVCTTISVTVATSAIPCPGR